MRPGKGIYGGFGVNDTHGGDIWGASREAGVAPERIIDFSANINPLGLSPFAREAIGDALGLVGAYPDPCQGPLREALSAYHGLSPSSILPANGSTELIYLIPGVFAPKRALIVGPAFSEYALSLSSLGCRVDTFLTSEKESFKLNPASLAARLKAGYDLVYVANPSSPTGALMERDRILELYRLSRRQGGVLVVDEAFMDFTEKDSVKNEARALEGLLVLRSMTKFFSMAGLRLGYLVANEEAIKRFSRVIPPWSVNTLAIVAGAATLKDASYMEKTLGWFKEESGYMTRELGRFSALKVFPSAANFFLVKLITDTLTGASLKKALMERSILIREFGGVEGLGERFLRVALLKRKENEVLLGELSSVLSGVSKGVNKLDRVNLPCYKEQVPR